MDNLMPGTTLLPGEEPEQREWDDVYEEIARDCEKHKLSAEEARTVWRAGLEDWELVESK